jgi:glycosyltransferase involved in cell wall biosynthesis
MRRDMKLMWSSNGPSTNSGYGVFTRDILYRMLRDKWGVDCNAFWGIQGYPVTLHGEDLIDDRFKGLKLKCYPTMDNPWGSDALIAHGNKAGANAVFTMQDVWTLDVNHLKQLKCFIPYCPIDKDPVPQGVLEKLQFAYRIITFSKFGQDALKKAGFTSTLILEGTDTEIFKPLDKKQCRADFNLPQDGFIFGMIAANKENPPRKGFQEALEAFKLFNDKHPEAYLLIHTQQMSPTGFPIQQYAQHLGILNKILFIDPYQAVFLSDSHFINKEMNCLDALLHPSQTEGFGLTIIEAQSAGIPAIINSCHSMPELIVEGKTGFACKTGVPRWTNDGSYTYPADINSLYEQMEKTYNLVKANPSKVKNDCRKHIKANFNLDTQYENQWKPFLEKLQDEILPQVLTEKKK